MNTKAVRIHGVRDVRLDEFELPAIREDQMLVRVYTGCLGSDTFTADKTGKGLPVITGHNPAGEILEVGFNWAGRHSAGEKFTLRTKAGNKDSFETQGTDSGYCGGSAATNMILSPEAVRAGCILPFRGRGFYKASLAESYAFAIGACRSLYHADRTKHIHYLGIKEGGRMAVLGGCGPKGLAVIDYALSGEFRPRQLVVTDHDNDRLNRARTLFGSKAETRGISLIFMNTAELDDPGGILLKLTDHEGFNDILVMISEASVLAFAENLLGFNGCLNFMGASSAEALSGSINYLDLRNKARHIIGTDGGKTEDVEEALELIEQDLISPEVLISHICGLDAVVEAGRAFPEAAEGTTLIYTGISLPLTALDELESHASESALYEGLARIVKENHGLWSLEAENYLLSNGTPV